MARGKSSGSSLDFEKSLKKLEEIVQKLEEEEIPLESALKLFAEGQQLARACGDQLRAAENRVRQLMESGTGELKEEDFEADLPGEDEEEPEETDEK